MDPEAMKAMYEIKEAVLTAVNDVSTRVTRIETKLDRYNAVKETAYSAKELSEDNEKAIEKLEDSQKWGIRTGIGSLVGLLMKVGYDLIFGR